MTSQETVTFVTRENFDDCETRFPVYDKLRETMRDCATLRPMEGWHLDHALFSRIKPLMDGYGFGNRDGEILVTSGRNCLGHSQDTRYSIVRVADQVKCFDSYSFMFADYPEGAIYYDQTSDKFLHNDSGKGTSSILHLVVADKRVFIDGYEIMEAKGLACARADTNNNYTYGYAFLDETGKLFLGSYWGNMPIYFNATFEFSELAQLHTSFPELDDYCHDAEILSGDYPSFPDYQHLQMHRVIASILYQAPEEILETYGADAFALKGSALKAIAELPRHKLPNAYIIEKSGLVTPLPETFKFNVGGCFVALPGKLIHAVPNKIESPDGYLIYDQETFNFSLLTFHLLFPSRVGCYELAGNKYLIAGFPFYVAHYEHLETDTKVVWKYVLANGETYERCY